MEIEEHPDGTTSLQSVWLDAHRRPQQTGRHVTLANREVLSEIELWDDAPSEPPPTYGSAALR